MRSTNTTTTIYRLTLQVRFYKPTYVVLLMVIQTADQSDPALPTRSMTETTASQSGAPDQAPRATAQYRLGGRYATHARGEVFPVETRRDAAVAKPSRTASLPDGPRRPHLGRQRSHNYRNVAVLARMGPTTSSCQAPPNGQTDMSVFPFCILVCLSIRWSLTLPQRLMWARQNDNGKSM